MAIVTINDDYLDNIAEAIREKGGTVPVLEEALETKVSKTINATGFDTCSGNYGNNRDIYDVVTITGATTIHVKMAYQTEAVSFDYVQVAAGNLTAMPEGTKKYGGPTGGIVELTFEGTDTVTFYFHSDETTSDALGYYAEVSGYTTEERGTEYRPKDMATAIQSITAGGGSSSAGFNTSDYNCYTVINKITSGADTLETWNCFKSNKIETLNAATTKTTSSAGDPGIGATYVSTGFTQMNTIPSVDKIKMVFVISQNSYWFWFAGLPYNKISDTICGIETLGGYYNTSYSKQYLNNTTLTLGFDLANNKFYHDNIASSLSKFHIMIIYED